MTRLKDALKWRMCVCVLGAVGRWSLECRMARCSREMVEWKKALHFLLFPYSLHSLEELCFSLFWWYWLQQTRAGVTLIHNIPWWLGQEENRCELTSHSQAFTSPCSLPPVLFSFKTGFYLFLWMLLLPKHLKCETLRLPVRGTANTRNYQGFHGVCDCLPICALSLNTRADVD